MNQVVFDKQIERLETNWGKSYSEKQKLMLFYEMRHMTDSDFIDTIQAILDNGKMRTLPIKSDFVEYSGGNALASHGQSAKTTALHACWEDNHECYCECPHPWEHPGLFWERKATGQIIDHADKFAKREEMLTRRECMA